MITWHTDNVKPLVLAVCISAAILYWQQSSYEQARVANEAALKAVLAETFFEVKSVAVPDFKEGENPLIIYDRTIKKPFFGFWNVEVHQVGADTDYNYCSGSGSANYEPHETLPKVGVKLDWFIGKDCALPVGQYRLQMNWQIHADGYPSKIETISSNIFKVSPK
ncbi:MAG: hypothetical protein M3O03_02785 [Pseudomonadota bacterium]|nr:hypothetical protein [Pseudomonadota bacterium]